MTVAAADGVTPDQLRDRLAPVLGAGYEVKTGAQLSAESSADLKEGMGFFNQILLGFAGVALFVGIFLILNTFSIVVAQRTRELALLRAVGEVIVNSKSASLEGDALIEAARDCDLIVSYRQSPGPAKVFESLPKLKAFLRCAIDIRHPEAASSRESDQGRVLRP